MNLNLFIDVHKEREGEYINADVEGLDSGTTEELGRLLAFAAHHEKQLKPIMFKAVAVTLHVDGHISNQDLYHYLEAIEEGEYEAVLDVLEYMER